MPETDAAYLDFERPLYFECVTSEMAEHTAMATEHYVEKGANVSDHVRPGLDKVTLDVFISNTILKDVNNAYGLTVEGVELDVQVMNAEVISTVLDVPSTGTKVYPTPGSLIGAATSAIGEAISGKTTYKAQGLASKLGPYAGISKAQILRHPKIDHVRDVIVMLDDWRVRGVLGKVYTSWKTYQSMVITGVRVKRTSATGDAGEVSIELKEVRLVESLLVTAPVASETRGNTAVAKGRQPTSFKRDTPKASTLRGATR